MFNIFEDNLLIIGNILIVKFNCVILGNVFVKVELCNLSFSVKCCIGVLMIWEVEKLGVLIKDKELIELIFGNIGIVFVFVVVFCGYKLILIMFNMMSLECCKLLKVLGVNLVLIDGVKGMNGVIEKVKEI